MGVLVGGPLCGLPTSVRKGVQEELPAVIARLIRGSTLWARPDLCPCERVRRMNYLDPCRILGSASWPFHNLSSVREGVQEELPAVIARLLRGSTFWARPDLFPGERVRQRSYLSPWCVAFWAPRLLPPHHLFPGDRGLRARG